jgi:NAD(P)-dependent dehydrogenase (short-subunit alcohol dehydrogenase family)
MDLGLSGKRALVTGASRGIGFGCARALAAEGCDVALVGRDVHGLKAAMKAIRADYRVGVTSHATDLTIPGRQEALIDVVGELDVLVNNAGSIPPGELDAIDDETWREGWELKVFGYINLTRLVLPQMEARRSGVIVNVIGTAALRPRADYITGAAGNSALVGFTRSLGSTSLRRGVRVVGVNPGLVATDRMEELLRGKATERYGNPERWEELIPADPPPGTVDQIASVVAFLASEQASHVSGTTVTVDGGASAS